MLGFCSEENVNTVIKESIEFSKYMSSTTVSVVQSPFTSGSTKTTYKAFLEYQERLKNKLENTYSSILVLGEMRAYERIMRYLEETTVLSKEDEKDLFHGDIAILMYELSKKVVSEFNFKTNVNDDFIKNRAEKYTGYWAFYDNLIEKYNLGIREGLSCTQYFSSEETMQNVVEMLSKDVKSLGLIAEVDHEYDSNKKSHRVKVDLILS